MLIQIIKNICQDDIMKIFNINNNIQG